MEDKNKNQDTSEKKSIFSKFNFAKSQKEEELENSDIIEEKTGNFGNIFDEFENDESLKKELKENEIKDKFYYLHIFGNVFKYLFIFVLVISSFSFVYTYIQKDENKSNISILDPICGVFLSDLATTPCSSISHYKNSLEKKLDNIKKEQLEKSISVIEKVYELENFTKTKDVYFLLDKSNNKLQAIQILDEFDRLKNEFDAVDKQKIECSSTSIDANNELLMVSCISYSAGYESGLRGFDGEFDKYLEGTSISIANSFLNFLSKQQNSIFTLIDRQKIFTSESIIGENRGFTNSTQFNIKLKYNLK